MYTSSLLWLCRSNKALTAEFKYVVTVQNYSRSTCRPMTTETKQALYLRRRKDRSGTSLFDGLMMEVDFKTSQSTHTQYVCQAASTTDSPSLIPIKMVSVVTIMLELTLTWSMELFNLTPIVSKRSRIKLYMHFPSAQ